MGGIINRRQVLAGAATLAVGFGLTPRAHAARAPAQIYLLRGGVVGIFSQGMNQIEAELARRGVDAIVEGHTSWASVARRIVTNREKAGPSPVILVGHSFGADAILKIAESIQKEKVRVDMLISLAATNPDPVPGNVRRAVGYFFSQHGWGLPLEPGPGFRGKLSNRDYSGSYQVGHFNIDKQTNVQNEILQLVLWSAGR